MLRWFSAVAAIAIFAGCGRPEEKHAVTPAQTMAGPAVLPIDREVPAKLETATFAVG